MTSKDSRSLERGWGRSWNLEWDGCPLEDLGDLGLIGDLDLIGELDLIDSRSLEDLGDLNLIGDLDLTGDLDLIGDLGLIGCRSSDTSSSSGRF